MCCGVFLAGCAIQYHEDGTPVVDPGIFIGTSPGHPLPKSVLFCREHDTRGRCKAWHRDWEWCVNPKGHEAEPPIVHCSEIKK